MQLTIANVNFYIAQNNFLFQRNNVSGITSLVGNSSIEIDVSFCRLLGV